MDIPVGWTRQPGKGAPDTTLHTCNPARGGGEEGQASKSSLTHVRPRMCKSYYWKRFMAVSQRPVSQARQVCCVM